MAAKKSGVSPHRVLVTLTLTAMIEVKAESPDEAAESLQGLTNDELLNLVADPEENTGVVSFDMMSFSSTCIGVSPTR
jgi:hypothetical protein